ncbi:MAG TPA: hypothetical protein VEB68_12250 [Croceibacterium sp.]|nr:hypothetical protein [Croceibacterium sp.]
MSTSATCLAVLLAAGLGACAHGLAPSDDGERTLRLGQTGDLGLVTVKPLQVLEDSRCAEGVQCVWAGRLRVRAEIEPPIGGHERVLTLGEEQTIAGGQLVLKEAAPDPAAGGTIDPADYRLVFYYRMPRPE